MMFEKPQTERRTTAKQAAAFASALAVGAVNMAGAETEKYPIQPNPEHEDKILVQEEEGQYPPSEVTVDSTPESWWGEEHFEKYTQAHADASEEVRKKSVEKLHAHKRAFEAFARKVEDAIEKR